MPCKQYPTRCVEIGTIEQGFSTVGWRERIEYFLKTNGYVFRLVALRGLELIGGVYRLREFAKVNLQSRSGCNR